MNPEKVNQLYNFLADNGVEDIGTDMSFMARMQNPKDRKTLYDFLDDNKVEGIGTTFTEFEQILGVDETPSAKIPSFEDFKEATVAQSRQSVEGRLAEARESLSRTTATDFATEQLFKPHTDIVQEERDYVLRPSEKVWENIDTKKLENIGKEEYKYLKGQRDIALSNINNLIEEAHKIQKQMIEEGRGSVKGVNSITGATTTLPSREAYKFGNIISAMEKTRDKYEKMVTEADKAQGKKGGLGAGLSEIDALNILTAGWLDVLQGIDEVAIVQKASEGRKLTPEEQLYIKMLEEKSRLEGIVEAQGGATQGYNIGSGLAESLPFITSMLTTGGIASAVKGVTRKGLGAIGREAAKEGAEKSFKKFAGRALSRGIDNLVGSAAAAAVTTPLQAGMYNNYIDNAVNEYMTYGKLTDSPIQRLWKSGADAFTDVFTENLGGIISGAAKYTLKNYGANAALGRLFGTFGRRIQPFYKDILKRTAYNGFVGEFEEEMLANLISPFIRGDSKEERKAALKEAISKETIITTLATTALMSAGFGAGKVVSAADATRKYEKFKTKARNALANIEDRRLEQELVDIMALPTLQERCQAFANMNWQGDYKSMGHGVDYFYNSILKEVYDGVVKMEDANEVVMPTLRTLNTVVERGTSDVVTAQMDGKPVYIIRGVGDNAESAIVQDMEGNRQQVAMSSLQEVNVTPVSEVVADLINKEYNAISAEMDAQEQAEEDATLRERGLVPPSDRAKADQFEPEEVVMVNGKTATINSIDKASGTARVDIEGEEVNQQVNIADMQKITPEQISSEVEAQQINQPALTQDGEIDIVAMGEEQTANYISEKADASYVEDMLADRRKKLERAQKGIRLPLNLAERQKAIEQRDAEIARLEQEIAMWEGVKNRLTQPQPTSEVAQETTDVAEAQEVALQEVTPEQVVEQTTEEVVSNATSLDKQGNPIDKDGNLLVDVVESIDDITDEDFDNPTRSIQLPALPNNVDEAIGADGKPVVIKKNIFERNAVSHSDLTPEQSRQILKSALYSPKLYGQNQKRRKPYNWVVISVQDESAPNKLVLLEINEGKDNVEIVHWHYIDQRGLEKLKRQAEREDGQLLILPSEVSEEVGALADPTLNQPSTDKNTTSVPENQTSEQKNVTEEEKTTEQTPEKEVEDTVEDIHTREQVDALEWEAGVVMNEEARNHKATEALDDMAKAAGVRVAFVDSIVEGGKDADGLYDPRTKTIYIASDRLKGANFVAGHEMLHHIKTLSPQAYNEYMEAVKAEVGAERFEKAKEGLRQTYRIAVLGSLKKRGIVTDGTSKEEREVLIEREMPSDEVLTEEVVADWTGSLIGYSGGFSDFVKRYKGGAVLRVLRNAVEHIGTFFKGRNSWERTMQRRLKALDTLLAESMGKTAKPSKGERKALLSIQESANSLVGVHNISLAKLNKAVKMGGLANPSVAVLDIDKSTHEDYGEISLILPSTMVDSRLGRNAGTWAGDAWTPTYPQVVKRIDKDEDISRFYKDINKMPDRMRNKVALDWNSYLEDRSAPALAYWFLFEKGNTPEMLTIPSKYPEEIVEQVRNATNGTFSLYQLSPEERMAVVEAFIAQEYNGDRAAYEKALQDKIEKIESRGLSHKSALVRKSAEQNLASIKEYGFDYDQISDFVREIGRDFNHRGEEDIEGTIRNAQEYIKENGLQDEFDAWKVELDNRYNVGEYIFNGYTNSGDRKWLPHTIENASKWMKKQGREGSVATFPSFGVFVAVAIPRMTSLASIRKRKSQLGKTEQEFNEFKDKWEPIYYELGQKLQPDAKGYEDYGWWRLIEAVGQKNPQEFIKTQYGVELSEEDMQKFNEMVNAIRTDYPAKYFETKFERPVQLSEFTAAVVPNTTPQEVENTLREAGVAVYEYDKNTEGSRKKVMLEATDSEGVRFALRLSPEEQEIVEKAKADGTYLKAPNGQPTNLTPKQWAQVRTKAFKEWFGDWEKATRIEKLRNSPSIIATGEEHIGKYELNNKSAAEYINSELRGSYTNKDTNEEIKITRKGAFKVTRHDAENEVHLKSIALIPKMLEDAIFITEEINEKGNSGFESYRYYIVGLNMGGVDYTAKLVIGVKNGETYYDHSLTEIEKTNLIDRRDEISSSFTANEDAIFEYKDKRLISILQINSSKIVDANGEPKVVYHGTPNIFTAFDKKMRGVSTDRGIWGNGFYFSESSDYADTYAKRKNSEGRTMELFLNVKKPLFISLKNGGNEGAMYFNTLQNKYFTDEVYDDINKVEENMVRAQENLSSEIESSGYDGVIVEYSHSTLADEYIAFEPTQIKSATENVGTFDANNPDVRFSIRTPDTFYSNAEFAVNNIKQEKATPEQWLKMIEKNGGLKAGEDKWLGLSDWLKESKAKTLTKQEVLDYINSNKIVVEDVEYGVQDYMSENEIYESDEYRALEESLLEYEDETPYIDKEKFKELRNKDEDFVDGFDVDYWGEQLLVKNPFAAARYLGISNVGKRINETRLEYTTNGLTNKREIALVVPTIEPWNKSDEIHFGDAGEGRAVAWVRFGDAEAPVRDANYIRLQEIYDRLAELEMKVGSSEGVTMEEYEERARLREERDNIPESGNERILVIDEIQSKRHQEGREKGYRTSDIDKYLKDNNVEVKETGEFYEFYKNGELDKRFSRGLLHYDINKAKHFYVGSYQKGYIPEAPFEKNWHEVAMKRILRYAAENGYDKVAWTTGDQQAERYNIGNVIESAKIMDGADGGSPSYRAVVLTPKNDIGNNYVLYVNEDGIIRNTEGAARNMGLRDKHLSDVVGKALAEKLLSSPNNTSISGDGLRIGGEGMRAFYDQILPNFMNKYGKKWGVKVGEVTMPDLAENNTMHSVDITPAMRESIMQGQPLFSLRLPEYQERFKALTEEYNALDKNDAKALADFRARKRTLVEEYWNDFARALGADVDAIAIDSTDNPEVLRPYYDMYIERVRDGRIEGEEITFEEFVEDYNKDEDMIAGHIYDSNIIFIDMAKTDKYTTTKAFTRFFIHEYAHTIIEREVSEQELIDIWNENANTEFGKSLEGGYKDETPNELGDEVLAYTVSGIGNADIRPLLNYIEGDKKVSEDDVLKVFGNVLPLNAEKAKQILKIIKNGYREKGAGAAQERAQLLEKGESQLSTWGGGRRPDGGYSAGETYIENGRRVTVLDEDISIVEDIPEFDESPKYSLKDPIEQLRKENGIVAKSFEKENELIAEKFGTEGVGRKIEKGIFNYLADVQRLQDNLYAAGVVRSDDNDFVNKMEGVRNMVERALPQELEKYVHPLLKVISTITKKFGFDYTAISDYLAAKHSIEREDESKIQTMSTEANAVWNRERVEKIVSDFESKVPENVRELLWKGVKGIEQRTLEILKKVGVYTAADIEAIQSHNWKYYVPLQGWDTKEEELIEVNKIYDLPQSGTSSTNGRWQEHSAKGRRTKPYDPLATIVAKLHKAVYVAETNKAMHALYNLVTDATRALGTEKVSFIFKASDAYYRKTQDGYEEIDADEVTPEELESNRKLHAELRKLYNERKQTDDAATIKKIDAQIKAAKSKLTIFVKAGDMAIPKEVNISQQTTRARRVYFYMNGKRMYIQFVNPKYSAAINGQTLWKRNELDKRVAGWTRWLSKTYTSLNPEFSFVTNPIRDFRDAVITHLLDAEHGNIVGFAQYMLPFSGARSAIFRAQRGTAQPLSDKELEEYNLMNRDDRKALIRKYGEKRVYDTLFKWYADNGGVTGGGRVYSVQTVADDLKDKVEKLKKGDISTHANALKALSDSAEITTRFATFLASLDKGESVRQAVVNGRNVSVNFNRKGAWSDKIGAYHSFFNASAQGIYKYLTLARKYPKRFVAVAMSQIALGYATCLLIDYLYDLLLPDDDGDEIQTIEIPLWERLGYTAIPFMRRNGKVHTIRIPKSITFASFSAIGVLLNELQKQRITGEEALLAAASQMMSSWTYGFSEGAPFWRAAVPTVLQPIADIMNNTDAFGREVYRTDRFKQGIPNSELGLRNVIPWMYSMTKALNKATGGNEFKSGVIDINPSVVQYIMEQYAGGFGVLARKAIEFGASRFTDKVEFEMQNLLLLGRLTYTIEPKSWYPDYKKVQDAFGAAVFSNARNQYQAGYITEDELRQIGMRNYIFKNNDKVIKNLIDLRGNYAPSSMEYKVINREINRQRGLVVKIFEEADFNNRNSISEIIKKYDPNRSNNLTNLYKEYAK